MNATTPTTPPTISADGGKLRGDASESSFSPEQWAFVERHLFGENRTLQWMEVHFFKEFGVKLGKTTWSRIWQAEADRKLELQSKLLRIQTATRNAQQIMDTARHSAPQTIEATLALIGQQAFELSLAETVDVESLCNLTKLLLTAQKQEREKEALALDREKFDLIKRKAEQAEATEKIVTNADLSAEERARRIAEIYGRA